MWYDVRMTLPTIKRIKKVTVARKNSSPQYFASFDNALDVSIGQSGTLHVRECDPEEWTTRDLAVFGAGKWDSYYLEYEAN